MVSQKRSMAMTAFLFLIVSTSHAWAQDDLPGSLPRSDNEQVGPTGPDSSPDRRLPESKLAASGVPSPVSAAYADYVVGPEDVLEIDVFDVPELSNKSVRVSNNGTISLPLIGQVQAAGLSARQLRAQLEAKWGETYLEDPQISVFIKEFHAQPVSVIGAVEKPGLYQVTGRRTLIEMLSTAGGLGTKTTTPAGRTVLVTRKGGFQGFEPGEGMRFLTPEKLEIGLRDLLYSQNDGLNIEIKPNDIISVSRSDVVYVTGAGVKRAGGFVLEDRDRVTVLQAIALASGLDPNAAKSYARIIRRQGDGTRSEIPVDLNKVLRGKAPDPELAPNDILFVPDSAQKIAMKRGAEAALSTVTGVLIWRR